MENAPFVSVIIPVYNDLEHVQTCLQALEEQGYPHDSYEVIVVDNGSDENVGAIALKYRRLTVCVEPRPGSYMARNTGVARARGEILAFTDADCIPASDWLEHGVAHLLNEPNCGMIGGKLEPLFHNPQHPTAIELYEVIMYFPQKRFVEMMKFSVTANLFTFRRIFEQVGDFDHTLKSGGDREWGERVASSGYRVCYADDVRVSHPPRASLAQLRRKVIRLSGGFEGIRKRKRPAANTVRFEWLLNHLPPLITVLRLRQERAYPVAAKEQLNILGIWGLMKFVEIRERVRLKFFGGEPAR